MDVIRLKRCAVDAKELTEQCPDLTAVYLDHVDFPKPDDAAGLVKRLMRMNKLKVIEISGGFLIPWDLAEALESVRDGNPIAAADGVEGGKLWSMPTMRYLDDISRDIPNGYCLMSILKFERT